MATRLLLRTSIARALAECTAAHLLALERIALRGGELEEVEDTEPELSHELKQRGLAFGKAGWVRIPSEVMPALPTGWSLVESGEVTQEGIGKLPAEQRKILDTLIATGGTGTSRDAGPAADPRRPIPQLLEAGYLHRVDANTVRLPRAVRDVLLGNPPVPTTPSGRQGEPVVDQAADDAGTAAGLDAVRAMERLLDHLGQHPIELLKDKAVGVRPIGRLSKELNLPESHVRWLVCLGLSARLLGRGEPRGMEGSFLAPTTGAAEWLELELGRKWEFLLEAWLESQWTWWDEDLRVGAAEMRNPRLPQHRRRVLDIYRHSAQPLNAEDYHADLRFAYPLFATHTSPTTIDALREEAEWIGAVARNQATSVLIETTGAAVRLTPEPVAGFIMQADMTVLVPGPLRPELHRQLEQVADLESPGLASVYRISDSSLRRGMDQGRSANEIREFFAAHALSDVPDTVNFHIADVAKRHGTLRSGPAMSYLRSEDPALLELAVRAVPQLRKLADTVAVSQLPVASLLETLRKAGYSPAAEDESGASLHAVPEPYTVPTPAPRAAAPAGPSVEAVMQRLRSHPASAPPTKEGASGSDGADLSLIQAAARGGRQVRIGYADKNGNAKTKVVTPLSVAGGQVDTLAGDGSTLRFPLHRIVSVELA